MSEYRQDEHTTAKEGQRLIQIKVIGTIRGKSMKKEGIASKNRP